MIGWVVVTVAAAFVVVPWVVALRMPHGDEGTLDEWVRRRGRD